MKYLIIILLTQLYLCSSLFNSFFSSKSLVSTSTINMSTKYPLQNDLMIRAARGEKVEKTPVTFLLYSYIYYRSFHVIIHIIYLFRCYEYNLKVWVFRQAGRHLPEYNLYKKEKGKNFIELLDDPVDVAEVTMQPIRRYNLDAAILFSDILVVLQAMDFEVTMPGGVGITVPNPLVDVDDYYKRVPKHVNVKEKLAHVIKAVTLIKEELKGKVPLIGFSAAPWTLMYYLVGGTSKKNQDNASKWLKNHPIESKEIMDLLATIIIDYLSAQAEAGADMLQVFEAMGEFISKEDFYTWALPSLTRIAKELKQKYPNIPLLVFPRGATYSLEALQSAGYDVVTLDTKTDRSNTRKRLEIESKNNNSKIATIQGNLDVSILQGNNINNSPDNVKQATRIMLEQLGPQKLIANLGEGLSGNEDPLLVAAFIDSVHSISEEMILKMGIKS